MTGVIATLANPYTQAFTWGLCALFAVFFARFVKKMSFGEDTGATAWTLIAIGLLLIGFRVSFKVIFPDYKASYLLQVTRYTTGIIGMMILYFGFYRYRGVLRRMYGVIG